MRKKEDHGKLLIDPSEVEEVYLSILSRVRELVFGEHKSIFTGSGFDFSGLREWQPGDRQSSIDWAHSTHTGFSPLIVRECVEERSVDVMIAADGSLSTRCGAENVMIGSIIAKVIATLGLSAVIFQDRVGLAVFGGNKDYFTELSKGGKNHVFNILELYQTCRDRLEASKNESLAGVISGSLRRTSLVTIISDFLFSDAGDIVKELADLKLAHDVFLVMIDASFAFKLPHISCGWIECVDAETGRKVLLSRGEYSSMASRVKEYQDKVQGLAEKSGLEVLRVGPDKDNFQNSIVDFFFERRLRKK